MTDRLLLNGQVQKEEGYEEVGTETARAWMRTRASTAEGYRCKQLKKKGEYEPRLLPATSRCSVC